MKGKRIIAIGPITADELRKEGLNAEIPKEYTIDGILNILVGGC